MPNLDEHSKHTKDRYGIEGRDIHSWMDEPCKIFGASHRKVRHDVAGIKDGLRLFSSKYSFEDIERVMVDHILLDVEDSSEVVAAQTTLTDVDYEIKVIEEKENKILKERLQRATMISRIKSSRVRNYIRIAFDQAREGSFKAVCFALSDWETFLLSRDNPNSEVKISDIDQYALSLKNRVKPRTASHYLQYLGLYFRHYEEINLSDRAKDRKKEFDKGFSKDQLRLHPKDVKMLYEKAKPKAKLMIRLLLLECQTDIGLLEKIVYAGKDTIGRPQFRIDDKLIHVNETTIKLAEPLLERNLRRGDNRLLSTGYRAMDTYISDFAKKVGLQYKVTPRDLRRFAVNQHPDVVLSVLGDKDE
jgi:hypothetical protein